MPAGPPNHAIDAEDGASTLPADTAPRPADAGQWDPKDLTSERDTELDTVTADRQARIRLVAVELLQSSTAERESPC